MLETHEATAALQEESDSHVVPENSTPKRSESTKQQLFCLKYEHLLGNDKDDEVSDMFVANNVLTH